MSEVSKFRVNFLSIVYYCAIHYLPTFRPHSVLPITASNRFLNRGIAETLDFEKTMKVQLENAEQYQISSNK